MVVIVVTEVLEEVRLIVEPNWLVVVIVTGFTVVMVVTMVTPLALGSLSAAAEPEGGLSREKPLSTIQFSSNVGTLTSGKSAQRKVSLENCPREWFELGGSTVAQHRRTTTCFGWALARHWKSPETETRLSAMSSVADPRRQASKRPFQ